jgi:hypothetical protein
MKQKMQTQQKLMRGASRLYWPRRRKIYFSRTHSPRTCICRVERYKIFIQYTHNICIAPKTTLYYTHITHTHTHTYTLSLTHSHTHAQTHSPTSSLPHTLTPSPHTELIELHPPRLGHIYLAEGLVELCQVIIRVVEVLLQQQLLVALQVRQGGGRATHGVSE